MLFPEALQKLYNTVNEFRQFGYCPVYNVNSKFNNLYNTKDKQYAILFGSSEKNCTALSIVFWTAVVTVS